MSSSATVRVEKATSDLLLGPDWTMNMEICDSINSDPGLAKDVVKVVKKRLQHKGPRVQFLALTLLETMIKNCGDFVHFQVVERDILQEMVRIVKKKTDMEVRDKILVLLDSWQEAFGGPGGKYPQFFWAYTDLKRSGVEFPHRSGDASLIFTPPTNHTSAPRHPQVGYGMPSNSTVRLDEAMASEMEKLSLSDLDRFRSVMDLLNDMLKAVNPHDREAVKDEVIADLVDQCRLNQKKILQLIDATGDEELLGQGLALNDSLQILLTKHNSIASGSPLPDEASISAPRPNTPAPATSLTTNRFIEDEEEEEEDDEFAQLARRNFKIKPTFESASTESSALAVSSIDVNGMTAAMVNTNEVTSSSVGGNTLALPDPPPPVKTTTKEQNIIDLLSITLSSNPSPPHTPITPSTTTHKKGSPESLTTNGQGYPHSPQTNPLNQGYIPYSSYVAPWAQTLPPSSSESQQHIQAQPHPNFHFRSEQQPPPQSQYLPQQQLEPEPLLPREHRPQLLPSQQPQPPFPPSQNPIQHPHPQPLVAQDASYPPPPWEDTSNTNPNPFAQPTYRFPASTVNTSSSYIPAQASTTPQQFNSFGMSAANPPVVIGQTRASANIGPAGSAAAKPFVPSYRLFEDLVDMRNPNRVVKSSNASGQGMANHRK